MGWGRSRAWASPTFKQRSKPMHKSLRILVPLDLHQGIRNTIPWGLRRHLMEAVLRLVVEAVEQEGPTVLGAIIAGHYKLHLRRTATSGTVPNWDNSGISDDA